MRESAIVRLKSESEMPENWKHGHHPQNHFNTITEEIWKNTAAVITTSLENPPEKHYCKMNSIRKSIHPFPNRAKILQP